MYIKFEILGNILKMQIQYFEYDTIGYLILHNIMLLMYNSTNF